MSPPSLTDLMRALVDPMFYDRPVFVRAPRLERVSDPEALKRRIVGRGFIEVRIVEIRRSGTVATTSHRPGLVWSFEARDVHTELPA